MSPTVHNLVASKLLLLVIGGLGYIPLFKLHQTKRMNGIFVLYTAILIGSLSTFGYTFPSLSVRPELHGLSIAGMGGVFLAFTCRGYGKISRLMKRVQQEGEVPVNAR